MTPQLTEPQRCILEYLVERNVHGDAPPTYREICERFGYRSPKAAADHVAALERKGLVVREKGCARGLRLTTKTVGVPVVGRIPAGAPREAVELIEQRLLIDPGLYGIRDRSKAFAVRITGDSMLGRQLCEGDLVVMERDVVPRTGDVVAALIDNEVTLKTFLCDQGKIWLRAENPKYPSLVPVQDLRIQGVARAVIRFLQR